MRSRSDGDNVNQDFDRRVLITEARDLVTIMEGHYTGRFAGSVEQYVPDATRVIALLCDRLEETCSD